MEMFLTIGGLGLVIVSGALLLSVWRTRRQPAEVRLQTVEEWLAERQADEDARRVADEKSRAAAEQETQRQADEDARGVADKKSRAAAEQETQRQADEDARRVADEKSRAAAEQETQRQADEDANAEKDWGVSSEPTTDRAPKYRPQAAKPPHRPPSTTSTAVKTARDDEARTSQNRAALIELRVLFERGGLCIVSLLPRRPKELPEECTVLTDTGSIDFVALSDEWYQDVVPDGLGELLHTGFVWTDGSTQQEWQLAGREVYVFATGTTHRGFVSCSRLILKREHLVMCLTSRLTDVEHVLREAGCAKWKQFGESDGAPDDWTILGETDASGRVHGIVPGNSVPHEGGGDILDVLRPLPQIEISLEGGISLGYNSWLAGYPPAVRIYGDIGQTENVLIDGQESALSDENAYTAVGWNDPGNHQVWCGGASKKYSLIRPEQNWCPWTAYSFPSPSAFSANRRIAICGPLVHAFNGDGPSTQASGWPETLLVTPSNPILIGAQPGQVFFAFPRADIRGAQCLVASPFFPVWALPAQSLRCDKSTNHILLIGQIIAPEFVADPLQDEIKTRAISLWCNLILNAGRKGLVVEPLSSLGSDLWRQYKRRARELWKKI